MQFVMPKLFYAYRIERRDQNGDILEHIAGIDDLEVANAAYEAARKRWPGQCITLRQGALFIEDSRR